jgi:hypothetical protein
MQVWNSLVQKNSSFKKQVWKYINMSLYDRLIDWLIDWCLTSIEQFVSYIQDENI